MKALLREVEELREKNTREVEALRQKNREADRQTREAEEDAIRERKRAEKAEERLGKAEERLGKTEERLEKTEERLGKTEERLEKTEERLGEAEARMQDTTIEEYLDACQKHLFDRLKVETDMARASQGGLTNPTKKWCPTKLLPWTDFLDEQKKILAKFYEVFPVHERLFQPVEMLKRFKDEYVKGNIKDEIDVLYVQRVTVQCPVEKIIEEIVKRHPVRDALGISSDMEFQSHVLPANENIAGARGPGVGVGGAGNGTDNETDNETDNGADNGADSEADNEKEDEDVGEAGDKAGSDSDEEVDRTRPDQTAVHLTGVNDTDGLAKRAIAFVVEYKAPHKLTAAHIRRGLQMKDVIAEVVNRPDIPTSDIGRFEYKAERLVAAAITQTYHYMIQNGLDEAFVFLRIDWRNPGNLYFHLAEPSIEVAAHEEGNGLDCTAISRVLAFSLLALRTQQKRRADRIRARKMAGLKTWAVEWELEVRGMSELHPPTLTNRRFILGKQTEPSRLKRALTMDTSTTPAANLGLVRTSPFNTRTNTSDSRQGSSNRSRKRSYCTQQCLLGLVCGFRLDPRCPNIDLHRDKTQDTNQHPFSRKPEAGLKCLWKEGARGVLMRITLLQYGYTFVAKGTNRKSIEHLRQEARIYERLRTLQGSDIPVFLGRLHLRQPYDYDYGMQVVYMLFLSWGGECVLSRKAALGIDQAALDRQLLPLLQKVHDLGVVHMDVRGQNVLWCEETRRVMLIDFERCICTSQHHL
ncbi:hypothetical protein F5144DRAFT_618382 [Chaetomium tenue]|uniref:Uncharacterized protein n=1 Tax=Chaetomium tenue TaxID=1854479 RepID=A0ACB7PIY0_9PEZI|nr:hypothetical protein F5144DRAFT_618382 [Chaetomium globosum]